MTLWESAGTPVQPAYCSSPAERTSTGFSTVPIPQSVSRRGISHYRKWSHTEARGIQRPHVEDINALHLAENFETLETGGLLEVGGNSAGGGTGAPQVINVLDLCDTNNQVSSLSPSASPPGPIGPGS